MLAPSNEPLPEAVALLRLVCDFLAALNSPEEGARFHRLHAPEALLPTDAGILPAGEIPRDDFAAAHRARSTRGAPTLPIFSDPRLRQVTASAPSPDHAVAWFEIAAGDTPQTLYLALGVRGEGATLRIGWATLAKQIVNWTYADGHLHTLGDYARLHRCEPTAPRAFIDASYFRLYWRAPVVFNTLPGARFSCQMSSACCKHDFEIFLPPDAQRLIDAMPWGTLQPDLQGTQLPLRADGTLQLKKNNESCRFLGTRGQCLIHQTLGRQPFSPCAVFPFVFAQTPEGIAVSLSQICGAVRGGLGVSPHAREDDLRERLAQVELVQPERFRLGPAQYIAWEDFRDIEKTLYEILEARTYPLRTRLYLGSRLLRALQNQAPLDPEGWAKESPAAITPELRAHLHDMIGRILLWDRATLRHLAAEPPADLATREIQEEAIIVQILHNTLHAKVYSYPYDLTTAHNFMIVLYLVALSIQAAVPGPLTGPLWQELGSLGVHGLLKSVLHTGVPDGFRVLFGTPEFGEWLLVA